MNDPRISLILDAPTFPDVPDSGILDSILVPLTGDPKTFSQKMSVKDLLNKVIVSAARPPAASDLIDGFTQVYRDTENQNMYISMVGGGWEYQSTKGVREQVYVGNFQKTTGTIALGEFSATATGIGIGAATGTPVYQNIAELRSNDRLFVGTKRLNVTQVSFSSNQWTLFGTWETAFSGLTFEASESIYFSGSRLSQIETIWSGALYSTETATADIQSLNAGKIFSDYDFLQFEFNVNHISVVARDSFAVSRDVNLTTDVGIIWIRNVSDTQFRTVGGVGSSLTRLTKILGIKGV